MYLVSLLLCAFLFIICLGKDVPPPPHIIYIIADDMGWNDVSFHGSDQIPTPNIDSLAYNGVILNRHYVQPLCTPSRTSLMTGKYPIHTGIHDALAPTHRAGLPLTEKIMPQYFKNLGYATHLVGKWHLGFYKKQCTPLERGFDSHFGYWSGAISYYDHINEDPIPTFPKLSGHDMRRNVTPAWDLVGQYATDLFTTEAINVIENHSPDKPMFMVLAHLAPHAGNEGKWLEAPQEEINRFSYITNPNRRTYAAMVSKLDQSVGAVVEALDRNKMLENSIIVFISDNGAPDEGIFKNWGSNYPWRGQKASLWEGGVRTPALIWSPLIEKPSRVSNDLMHITDWLPTLLAATGSNVELKNIDGVNQWETLSRAHPSLREELVVDIDPEKDMSAMIIYNLKYVKGPIPRDARPEISEFLNLDTIVSHKVPKYDIDMLSNATAWQPLRKYSRDPYLWYKIRDLRQDAIVTCNNYSDHTISCSEEPCLFYTLSDPCEQNNIAKAFPHIVNLIQQALDIYKTGAVPSVPLFQDRHSNPDYFNGDWSIWMK